MTVQPAFEIVLEAHGQSVTLRADLRAAVAISAMPGSFPEVSDQISRLSWSAIRGAILATATDRQDAHRFLAATADMPLCESIHDAQAACLAVLAAILHEPTEPPQGHSVDSEAIPLREYFQSLFSFATGWLGWTPTEAWAASPAEIAAVLRAQGDKVSRMTTGVSSDTDQPKASTSTAYTPERLKEIDALGYDPAFDRAAFERLKAQQ